MSQTCNYESDHSGFLSCTLRRARGSKANLFSCCARYWLSYTFRSLAMLSPAFVDLKKLQSPPGNLNFWYFLMNNSGNILLTQINEYIYVIYNENNIVHYDFF